MMPDIAAEPAAMNALVGMIYSEVCEEQPWIRSLEALRGFIPCNTMALQVTVDSQRAATYFFAAGRRVESADIATWEHREADQQVDFGLVENRVMICNDWSQRPAQAGFLRLLKKYDVLRTMSIFVASLDGVQYHLHACRSIKAAVFNAGEEAAFLLVAPHFARAIGLRQKLAYAQITRELQADAMDRLAVGGVMLDSSGRISVLNEAAERILREQDGLRLVNAGLRAASTATDRLLQGAIAAALSPDVDPRAQRVRAILVDRPSGRRALGLVINRRRMRNFISDRWQNGALIFIRDPDSKYCEDAIIFRQLFKFTRAEANFAVELANGLSVEEVEAKLRISHNTIRAHLRSMFLKTGVSSRAELIRVLVNGVAPLAAAAERSG
jgi:DNA-binding CsgD family transcriptional regulator